MALIVANKRAAESRLSRESNRKSSVGLALELVRDGLHGLSMTDRLQDRHCGAAPV